MRRLLPLAWLIGFPFIVLGQAVFPPTDVANYRLEASLDAKAMKVAGTEHIRWRNTSSDAVGELQFHLYMNAFRNTESTFFRESGGGSLRGDRAEADSFGSIEVSSLRVTGGADLTRQMQFIQPDDGNKSDRTVMRVPLPRPVGPGETIELDASFETKLPRVFARSGYHGQYVLVGQWFPKLGVYEAAGVRYATTGHWNCHQYHATSEFYADFGSYDARLTVPSKWVVGATGVQTRLQPGGATTTYEFHQDNVHDFAWTASPKFVRTERTFQAAQEVSASELAASAKRLGVTVPEVTLRDVKMILLLQPEHAEQTERHFRALRAALKYFGLWYGAYPHATITMVDPPRGASGSGGMEYPTFITIGTGWHQSKRNLDTEETVVHEFGHQYWQGMVASNEFEEAFLDEGFNTYSTGKVMELVYGDADVPVSGLGVSLLGVNLDRFFHLPAYSQLEVQRSVDLLNAKVDSVDRFAWQYRGEFSYTANSYMSIGVRLLTLEGLLGDQTMARVMRGYFQRWKFRHPSLRDFERTAGEVSGRELSFFFDPFFHGNNVLDYAVGAARSEPVESPYGYVERNGKPVLVKQEEADKLDEERSRAKSPKSYRTLVRIERRGEIVLPVTVLVRFENGEQVREQWDGTYRWCKFEYVKPTKLASVEIDPDHRLPVDQNLLNNSYQAKGSPLPALQWSSTLGYWLQSLIALAGMVN